MRFFVAMPADNEFSCLSKAGEKVMKNEEFDFFRRGLKFHILHRLPPPWGQIFRNFDEKLFLAKRRTL